MGIALVLDCDVTGTRRDVGDAVYKVGGWTKLMGATEITGLDIEGLDTDRMDNDGRILPHTS